MAEKKIVWDAPEFIHYNKTHIWTGVIIVISLLVIGLALWQRNFLMAVFGLVGGALIIYWGHRKPEVLTFTLSKEGLDIKERRSYPMESFVGFAIVDDPEQEDMDELVLQKESTLDPFLNLSIKKSQRKEIEDLFKEILPEIDYEEPAMENVSRWLRF